MESRILGFSRHLQAGKIDLMEVAIIGVFLAMAYASFHGWGGGGGGRYGRYDWEEPADPMDADVSAMTSPSFSNCTTDCSGHQAGYDWAAENGIENINDCSGESNSFIDGCEQFVRENHQ